MHRPRPFARFMTRLTARMSARPIAAALILGASLGLAGCNSSSLTDGLQPIGNGSRAAATAPDRPDVKKLDPPGPLRYGDHKPVDFGRRHPDLYPVHGIDVSKWQGDIDWNKVKRAGVAFAFIKSTEGGDHKDSRFEEYWRQARAAGIPHAPYHFYYFCRPAAEQAAWFIANVPRESVQMPPVLDVEWNHHSKTCTKRPDPATVRAEMKTWMDIVGRYYGKRPIIYTPVDFHRENLDGHFK
ncbi:MAG: GH25 family lysozyme, partial [Hoeflea sp.]